MLNEVSQFINITAVRVSIALRIPFLEKYFSSTLQVKQNDAVNRRHQIYRKLEKQVREKLPRFLLLEGP
jgi:hypothetical protein